MPRKRIPERLIVAAMVDGDLQKALADRSRTVRRGPAAMERATSILTGRTKPMLLDYRAMVTAAAACVLHAEALAAIQRKAGL